MQRHGDPQDWENEVHRVLTPVETAILRFVLDRPELVKAFDATMLLDAAGKVEAWPAQLPKTHRAMQLWINRLERGGHIEKYTVTSWFRYEVTRYGRWAMGERT